MTPCTETSSGLLEVVLAGYLAKHCTGLARARTQGRIARDLVDLGLNVTLRGVRDAVARLRLAGCPVGTAGAGVYLCAEGRDWRVGYRYLYTRLRTQAAGVRAFHETFRRATSGQAVFDFDEALSRYQELLAVPLLAGLPAPADGLGVGPDRQPCGPCGERLEQDVDEPEPAEVAASKRKDGDDGNWRRGRIAGSRPTVQAQSPGAA